MVMGSAALVLGVCLQLAASNSAHGIFVPTEQFTLAWDHSIEKIRWEEDYAVVLGSSGQPVLQAQQARIKGSGSGMEPPADAVYREGAFYYTPVMHSPELLRLTRSEFVPDYQWCDAQGCRPLSAIIPRDGGVTMLRPCARPRAP